MKNTSDAVMSIPLSKLALYAYSCTLKHDFKRGIGIMRFSSRVMAHGGAGKLTQPH